MPILGIDHIKSIENLIRDSKSIPSHLQWLFPSKLKATLDMYETNINNINNAWIISNTFLKNTWFFQRWIFSCLDVFSQSELTRCATKSLQARERAEEHSVFDYHINPKEFKKIQGRLRDPLEEGSLKLSNYSAARKLFPNDNVVVNYYLHAAEYPETDYMPHAICALNTAGLFAVEVRDANYEVISKPGCGALYRAQCLIALHKADLLIGDAAQSNRDLIKNHPCPKEAEVITALNALRDAGLFSQETPETAAIAQANFNIVMQNHKAAGAVGQALVKLGRAGLLKNNESDEIRAILAEHEDPIAVANVIICLQRKEPDRLMIYAQNKISAFFTPAATPNIGTDDASPRSLCNSKR